jgi:hypothetical protein
MADDEAKRAQPGKGCKTLPPVALQWEPLPPMLHLEMQLRPGTDLREATTKIQLFLAGLSEHYKNLGGRGLRYHPKQLTKVWADVVLRIVLYPLESEDVRVQQDRLQQILEALQSRSRHDQPPEVVRLDAEVKLKAG